MTTVKVEGAEIEVCNDCKDFGTEVKQQSSSGSTSKYSTSSSSGTSSGSSDSSGSSSGSSGSSGSRRRRDMYDQMDELAQDYDQRIRTAREQAGLTQEELANQLNEKTSLIRKLEHGDVLPSDDVQKKLERHLDISLVEGPSGEDEETEWESSGSSGTYTLGDVVKRKD